MRITNRPNNRPPHDVVERIATEEAAEAGARLGDVLSMRLDGRAKLARRRAWKRILRETGCSVSGLADVWGCDRQAIEKAIRKPEKPKGQFPILDEPGMGTFNRLAWQYGPERAMRIATRQDEPTNWDVAFWRAIGDRPHER